MQRRSLLALSERWLLPLAISVITVLDGSLHLRLIYLLFGGTLWGSASPGGGGPPPGGPPPPGSPVGPPGGAGGPPPGGGGGNPFPLPLNEMFFLNFVAAIALVLAFWIAYRWFRQWLWLVDAAIVAFAAFSIWGWFRVHRPNPQNLGHITKGLEVALIVLVIVHAGLALRAYGLPRGARFRHQRPSAVQ